MTAAYDSVPLRAVVQGLKRLKAPDLFIKLLQSMDKDRSLFFDTNHGPTRTISPGRGLAQGSLLSPTLWNIFYDPMLCAIHDLSEGFAIPTGDKNTFPTTRLTSISYADDVHNISSTNTDFQKQLNIIYDFLSFWGMQMNPGKSKILCNLNSTDPDFPTPSTFKLGQEFVPNVLHPGQVARVLGTYISLDANSKNTRDHAIYKGSRISTIGNILQLHSGPNLLVPIERRLPQ